MNARRASLIVAAVLMLTTGAVAGDPQTWEFEIETAGEDVSWTSLTTVRTDALQYQGGYMIDNVWVTVIVFGFPVEVNVTDQIPPELLSGSDLTDGPAPIVLFDESFTYPPPPEDPSIAATLTIGLDRDGFGYFNATDIILGAVDTPFGFLQIEALRVAGSVTVTPIGTFNPSDVNGDGAVNVIDLLAVLTAFGSNDPDADVNDDGVVNVIDLLQVLQDWTG